MKRGSIVGMAEALKKFKIRNEEWTKTILQAAGFKENEDFIHQYIVDDKYIVDFAFEEEKIVVEADGKSHRKKIIKNKDKERDNYLFKNGWIIIRLNDKQLLKEPSFCKSLIKQMVVGRRNQQANFA